MSAIACVTLAARAPSAAAPARKSHQSRVAARATSTSAKDASAVRAPSVADRKELPRVLTRERVQSLEAELDSGASVKALRRFNDNIAKLDKDTWAAKLRPVFNELAHNLETFNPAFTAVVLKVQMTVGESDYDRRDTALQHLIQPLAGEYGLAIGQPLMKTHRRLFAEWYESVMHEPLAALLGEGAAPVHSLKLFSKMIGDIQTGGGHPGALAQASYAMGYNLAIEYLADYEKTWMLDSFRAFDNRVLSQQGREVEYLFLEVHAEHECEHAAIGHAACVAMVPEAHEPIVREAMLKHDADLAAFYNALADMLE